MPISCCVMFWAHPGMETELSRYLDIVVGLETEHGGVVLQRAVTNASDDQPLEVHMLQFASLDMYDNFMGDPRRAVMAPERERVIARMEIMQVTFMPVPVPRESVAHDDDADDDADDAGADDTGADDTDDSDDTN